MALARFQLLTAGTELRLSVNGEPVPGVASVRLAAGPGKVTQMWVEQAGDALIDGEGVVHVGTPAATGPAVREALLAWLGQIDPNEVERSALDRQGWGSGSLAAEVLDVLRELAGTIE